MRGEPLSDKRIEEKIDEIDDFKEFPLHKFVAKWHEGEHYEAGFQTAIRFVQLYVDRRLDNLLEAKVDELGDDLLEVIEGGDDV